MPVIFLFIWRKKSKRCLNLIIYTCDFIIFETSYSVNKNTVVKIVIAVFESILFLQMWKQNSFFIIIECSMEDN